MTLTFADSAIDPMKHGRFDAPTHDYYGTMPFFAILSDCGRDFEQNPSTKRYQTKFNVWRRGADELGVQDLVKRRMSHDGVRSG